MFPVSVLLMMSTVPPKLKTAPPMPAPRTHRAVAVLGAEAAIAGMPPSWNPPPPPPNPPNPPSTMPNPPPSPNPPSLPNWFALPEPLPEPKPDPLPPLASLPSSVPSHSRWSQLFSYRYHFFQALVFALAATARDVNVAIQWRTRDWRPAWFMGRAFAKWESLINVVIGWYVRLLNLVMRCGS